MAIDLETTITMIEVSIFYFVTFYVVASSCLCYSKFDEINNFSISLQESEESAIFISI